VRNGLAENGQVGVEYWVLTPLANGTYTLASHGELDNRDFAAFLQARRTLDDVLEDLRTAHEHIVERLTWALLATAAFGALLLAAVAHQFRARVVVPIRHLTHVAEKIRAGDLERRTAVRTDDELETLGQSINAMLDRLAQLIVGEEKKQRLEGNILKLLKAVSRASEGDLTARGEVTPDELGSVVDAFNHMLTSIGHLVGEVRRQGEEVTRSAEAILQASERMAAGAERQATALDDVARKMKDLGQRSLEITRIVELVDDIANQTNLLALNAAIEASRAPDSVGGKGFAIIAEEVRKLAERSGAATKDIAAFIESIQVATSSTGAAIDEIRDLTRRTTDGARDQTNVAGVVVQSARALEGAIARFKMRPSDDPLAHARVVEQLRQKKQELERALDQLLADGDREAAERVLEDLGQAGGDLKQQIPRR
jgi:methyl-accepting chemotaxis protein